MTVYVTGTPESQGAAAAPTPPASGGGEGGRPLPLVSSPISQKTRFSPTFHQQLECTKTSNSSRTKLLVYPATVKIKRPNLRDDLIAPSRAGSSLDGFSDKSRGRLRFTATNAREILRSQFGLTYHDQWPTDGREFKRHLNLFLTRCRQAFPFLSYLWIAEFQSRGAPHVHLFLDLPPTPDHRATLAAIWCSIVDPSGADSALRSVHNHPSNFIGWKMGTGSYLCKYLDKQAQKAIPQGFTSFGRWWGNSRGLVPPPDEITPADLRADLPQVNEETGEVSDLDAWQFLVRTVGRYHEETTQSRGGWIMKEKRRIRRNNRRRKLSGRQLLEKKNLAPSWFRRTNRSTSCLTGAPIFRQALDYLRRNSDSAENPVPPW